MSTCSINILDIFNLADVTPGVDHIEFKGYDANSYSGSYMDFLPAGVDWPNMVQECVGDPGQCIIDQSSILNSPPGFYKFLHGPHPSAECGGDSVESVIFIFAKCGYESEELEYTTNNPLCTAGGSNIVSFTLDDINASSVLQMYSQCLKENNVFSLDGSSIDLRDTTRAIEIDVTGESTSKCSSVEVTKVFEEVPPILAGGQSFEECPECLENLTVKLNLNSCGCTEYSMYTFNPGFSGIINAAETFDVPFTGSITNSADVTAFRNALISEIGSKYDGSVCVEDNPNWGWCTDVYPPSEDEEAATCCGGNQPSNSDWINSGVLVYTTMDGKLVVKIRCLPPDLGDLYYKVEDTSFPMYTFSESCCGCTAGCNLIQVPEGQLLTGITFDGITGNVQIPSHLQDTGALITSLGANWEEFVEIITDALIDDGRSCTMPTIKSRGCSVHPATGQCICTIEIHTDVNITGAGGADVLGCECPSFDFYPEHGNSC